MLWSRSISIVHFNYHACLYCRFNLPEKPQAKLCNVYAFNEGANGGIIVWNKLSQLKPFKQNILVKISHFCPKSKPRKYESMLELISIQAFSRIEFNGQLLVSYLVR